MTYLSDSMMVVLPQPLAPTIMVRGRLEEIIMSGKMGCRVAGGKEGRWLHAMAMEIYGDGEKI
jgi:hypothetical protein